MIKTKYLILGAGPAGLAFANSIMKKGETDFLVIEKEDEAGGLCRSAIVDGSPLDIGGGHFLDVRRRSVNEFLFEFMPEEEWNLYERDSRIEFRTSGEKPKKYVIHHPFEANIWELPKKEQKRYLDSIAEAGCNTGVPKPERFVPWITWKLGKEIANDYMLPYNSKMFADNLNELGTYWLDKLPNVSYEETLESCKNKMAYGRQPGHARFYYPKKYGYGELFRRMGDALGDKLILGCKADAIDCNDKVVTLSDGTQIICECIINTVPWDSFELKWAPTRVKDNIKRLKHTSVNITYYPKNIDTEAQWIYYPDKELEYHRILVRHNFCEGSRGYWTECRSERYTPKEDDITFRMEYAYPLNTLSKPDAIASVLSFGRKVNILGLGRWGEHEHFNSDVTVKRAMELADKLCGDNDNSR